MNPSFQQLRENYPKNSKSELYAELGGDWPGLIDNPNYANTCSIRLSLAFARSGYPISKMHQEAITGSGIGLILRVKTMQKFVTERLGDSDWGLSKRPNEPLDHASIPARSGVIVYHADWADASGHFDLWTATGFVGNGSFDAISDGFSIALWYL